MNKYEINPMLIHVKEEEQTVRAYYVVVLTMQNAYPYFEWNRLLDTTANFSSRNQMKTRQENVDFLLSLTNLRCVLAKLLMYEHTKNGVH